MNLYEFLSFCIIRLPNNPSMVPILNNKPKLAACYSEKPNGLTIEVITIYNPT